MNVYFDNAATTAVRDEVIDAMSGFMKNEYGNPSSPHFMGRNAANVLAEARKKVADGLGGRSEEIHFTSGGTEANNWAILGSAELLARRGKHIVTSAIEHDSVLAPIKKLEKSGWEVTFLSPNEEGYISVEAFGAALREDTVFASVMLVNNETGAVNPIGEYAKEISRRKLDVLLHTDTVQGFGKVAFRASTLDADMISISAHKLHGPKGVGALYIKKGLKLPPLLLGGGQENGRRGGTESLPAIVGFGVAASISMAQREENTSNVSRLHKYIVDRFKLELPEALVIVNGGSPYILSISLPGYKSEVLMSFLEGEGICVSKSAACKKGGRSHVLEAMGLKNDVIDGALRISFSGSNTELEAHHFVETLKAAAARLRK